MRNCAGINEETAKTVYAQMQGSIIGTWVCKEKSYLTNEGNEADVPDRGYTGMTITFYDNGKCISFDDEPINYNYYPEQEKIIFVKEDDTLEALATWTKKKNEEDSYYFVIAYVEGDDLLTTYLLHKIR